MGLFSLLYEAAAWLVGARILRHMLVADSPVDPKFKQHAEGVSEGGFCTILARTMAFLSSASFCPCPLPRVP